MITDDATGVTYTGDGAPVPVNNQQQPPVTGSLYQLASGGNYQLSSGGDYQTAGTP